MVVAIREAGPADMAMLDGALRQLSADLGDVHRASAGGLAEACHGPRAFASAVLAADVGLAVGAALFAPVFSTTLGGPGLIVSDLWVTTGLRGTGLGRRLLAEAAKVGGRRWEAGYIRLTTYAGRADARAFYERLGFAFRDADRNAILAGDDFRQLAGDAR